MSAQTMKAQGEKTRAKILKTLGKKPKTAAAIAQAMGLSIAYVRTTLKAAAKKGMAVGKKQGREVVYSAPADTAQAYKSVGSFTD